MEGIAIIGMACRFPGADNPVTFWNNLCHGVESITFFSDKELLAAGVEPTLLHDPHYVKAAPILPDIDKFDAAFFAYSPAEATLMDPQHRLLLEVAWEAFEDAGYHAESYEGVIGVFAGAGGVVTSYLMAHQDHMALRGQTGGLPHIGNDKDFLSTRVSYKLNLTGPSLTVQTACSTSLVAVHLACQSLLNGECDMVLAGASTVRIPHIRGYRIEKGNILSPDGHCRAFDAAAQGTIFGSGVGAVLLKSLPDAVADGDHIYAVIKSTAVNNDGAMKVSYTASSVTGQARAMVEAMTLADVSPATLGYIECHGTGTTLGDPLEIRALTTAFRTQTARTQFCAVGSVKTNIGHLEQAAGIAGLIKTALTLYHKRIPPSLHFVTPNPKIDFATSPFYVSTTLQDWPSDHVPRRAAVNSLGLGGTNAFVVLEEAPPGSQVCRHTERSLHLFGLSAKTETGLLAYAERLHAFLATHPDMPLADVCYTTNVSRTSFPYRLAVTADTIETLQHKLAALGAGKPATAITSSRMQAKPVVFLFTGQGSQYPGMARDLYHTQSVFRAVLEQCDALLRPYLDKALLDVLFADGEDALLVHETAYTQPALFAVEYALAQLWQTWGVVPSAVMGHSVGELVAACIAGVFELEEALRLVAERGRLMQSLPKQGAMAAVFAPVAIVREALLSHDDLVSIAAINTPQNTVISGEQQALADVLKTLQAHGIASQTLTVSHAFHSSSMTPMLDALEATARHIKYNTPRITLISNLTGQPMEQAPGPAYWREHARQPVLFFAGIQTLQAMHYELFVEIGPGNALLGMGQQCLPEVQATWLPSIKKQHNDWHVILESLRVLYLAGWSVNWQAIDQGDVRHRLSLPTYPFQRERYWLDPSQDRQTSVSRPTSPRVHPLLGERLRSALQDVQFEALYSTAQLSYLLDHRMYGMTVLPTTAGLEAALAAGRAYFGAADLCLENLIYHEALVLPEDGGRLVQLILTPQGANQAAFQLLSTEADGGDKWRRHMSGILSTTITPPADAHHGTPVFSVEEGYSRCPRRLAPERYYTAVRDLGLAYGPSFQGIQQLWQGTGEALSKVCLPPHVLSGPYQLHPAFLDACLHIYPALATEYGDFSQPLVQHDQAYLPIGLERFRIYQEHATEAWVHAVLRNSTVDKATLVMDIRLYDEASNMVAAFDGLSVRRLPPAALHPKVDKTFTDWLYHVRWVEQSPSIQQRAMAAEAPASWLILADRGGVGEALAALLQQRGDRCHLVYADTSFARSESDHWTIKPMHEADLHRLVDEVGAAEHALVQRVVYLWGLDLPTMQDMTLHRLEEAEALGTGGLLYLLQALAKARAEQAWSPRVWIVTRNAQNISTSAAPLEAMQAPLWGLGRVIPLELPHMWGGLIDLPPRQLAPDREDAEALLAEILRIGREDQVALRDGKRFVARLVPLLQENVLQEEMRFRNDATYLIIGGLGALGSKIAQWLVTQQGIRYVVLTGRRGAAGGAQDTVQALTALGAQVHVIKADIAVEADVQRVMEEIQRHLPPLKGVIHCAGVLDDGILNHMDWPQFTRVTAPKIKGGWLLHRYTQSFDLDFFVLFSSILSRIGSAGQANYTAGNAFLDALVGYRRALGLPAMAINWGPWDEAGLATVSGSRGEAIWRTRGTRYIPSEDGLRVFDYLMHHQVEHAAVTRTDWAIFLEQFPEPPPLYAELVQEAGVQHQGKRVGNTYDVQARLRQAPVQEHRAILLAFVRAQVMDVLGFTETMDIRQPLNDLGLDSLLSINLINRLEPPLAVSIPIVKLLQGPSVEQLVDELFPDLSKSIETATMPEYPQTSKIIGNGWLVFPKPNIAAQMRLFCFPFAGGGASTYRSWVESLQASIEVVAIEPPGRASRIHEKPLDTLDAFLDTLVPAMLPYLDKPFAFFGHCLGGLTLFATARILLNEHNLPPHHLFVSGARPPHRLLRYGPFEEQLLSQLTQHKKFDPFLPMYEQPDEVFVEIIRHFNIGATEDFLNDPDLRRLMLPTIRGEFAMSSHYRFAPEPAWDIPITCFTGLDDPYVTREDAVEWSRYTRVAFRLHMRGGAHFIVVDDRTFILESINRELSV
jgi:acyl transferase domain-containing protein/surfactin synthase thioesterase subunit/acyl carrier protein